MSHDKPSRVRESFYDSLLFLLSGIIMKLVGAKVGVLAFLLNKRLGWM